VTKRVRVLVSGDVQGVGFRWYCHERASVAGVAGFVRNLADGRVEAAFEGDDGAVDDMVAWCRSGPRWARVTGVDVYEEALTGSAGFAITR
jgi:acylphosphatase